MKKVLPLIIIALIGVVAFGLSIMLDTNSSEVTIPEVVTVEWSSTIVGESEFGAPISVVSVIVDGTAQEIASVAGTCSDNGMELLENQISSYLCWWAGGGSEFGVFMENNQMIIKKGIVEEGGAEFEGFRGNFEVLDVEL